MLAGVVVSSILGGMLSLGLMLVAEQSLVLLALSYSAGGTTAALGFILRAVQPVRV